MKDIYLVGGGRFRYTHPINSNVYLVDGGQKVALIDAGCGFGIDSLIQSIKNHGFEPSKIDLLINTHSDWDHARGDSKIKRLSQCKIALNKHGMRTLQEGPWAKGWSKITFEPVVVDLPLDDGDTIEIGKYKLQAIHTPGHSLDSMCFLMHHEGKKVLFSGDTVLSFGKLGIVSAETDFAAYKDSLKKLIDHKVDVLLPGHGIFILSYAHEQIEFALTRISSKWPDFVSYPVPFDSGAWDVKCHPEWLAE